MSLLSYWKSLILPNLGFGFIGAIASGIGIVSGLSNIFGGGSSGQPSTAPGTATATANPLAPYQQGWADQLNKLMQNPSSVTQTPGYQFGMEQGAGRLQAQFAGSGQGQSGAETVALQDYGQQYAGKEYQQQVQTLGNLATGGALGGAQYGSNQQQQGYGNLMQGLGGLSSIYGASQSMGGYSPGYTSGSSSGLPGSSGYSYDAGSSIYAGN